MQPMKTFTLISCFVALCAVTKAQSLTDFDWIKGNWSGTSDGASISESWKQLDDNTLAGSGFVVAGKDTVVREIMLIQRVGDQMVFIARINDGDPVLFTLRGKNANGEYVFENKEHDFPQRVVYAPGSGKLNARIEGLMDGKAVKEAYSYDRK